MSVNVQLDDIQVVSEHPRSETEVAESVARVLSKAWPIGIAKDKPVGVTMELRVGTKVPYFARIHADKLVS